MRNLGPLGLLVATAFSFASDVSARADEMPLAKTVTDATLAWGPCPPVFPGACEIAVLHGDPAKANADVFLRVGGGYVLPAHIHTSAERIVLVTGKLQVQYKGNGPVTMLPGHYAYGPAKLPHTAKCLSVEPCTLFIAFEQAVDAEAVSGPM